MNILGYTTDISQQVIIAFSFVSNFKVYLPAGNEDTSLLNLVVHIRDTLDCITEYNMSSVVVRPDSTGITDVISSLQSASTNIGFVRLLSGGNQNTIGQLLTSFSQEFNKMNTENVDNAVSSK